MKDVLFRDLLESVQEGAEIMTRIDWKVSELEELLAAKILEAGLPTPKRQYKFHSSRKWLADFAWPESRLIVEVNGGTHQASRGHTSFSGIHRDYEKANAAQDMNYRYYQFDREMVEDGTAIRAICDYLGRCEG